MNSGLRTGHAGEPLLAQLRRNVPAQRHQRVGLAGQPALQRHLERQSVARMGIGIMHRHDEWNPHSPQRRSE